MWRDSTHVASVQSSSQTVKPIRRGGADKPQERTRPHLGLNHGGHGIDQLEELGADPLQRSADGVGVYVVEGVTNRLTHERRTTANEPRTIHPVQLGRLIARAEHRTVPVEMLAAGIGGGKRKMFVGEREN